MANAGGPYAVNEGGTVTLSGSGSTGTSLTYAWDLDGDGVYGETGAGATRGNETGATPTFSAVGLDGAASRSVSLRVTDDQGRTSTASATINIANVAPTLAIGGNAAVNEGASYTLNLSASGDPGSDTISQWLINWGDGSAARPSAATRAASRTSTTTTAATRSARRPPMKTARTRPAARRSASPSSRRRSRSAATRRPTKARRTR